MKSIGMTMYAIAPATSSLSVFETRRSVSNPPSSLRKFGSSFTVDISVRLAPARDDGTDVESASRASRGRVWARDAAAPKPAAPVVRRFREEAVPERADCLFTYADLPVAVVAESGLKAMRAVLSSQPDRSGPAAVSKKSLTTQHRLSPCPP